MTKSLPTGFDTDEARENDAYDDLIDIFVSEGQTSEAASASASTLLATNLNSVSKLHANLAAVLMHRRSGR